ncbi:MAG: hypothetical protein HYS13_16080 [Planctomycetia bacterium]|nr:hypothetical protein [Planctomycetia bacterium]
MGHHHPHHPAGYAEYVTGSNGRPAESGRVVRDYVSKAKRSPSAVKSRSTRKLQPTPAEVR